MPTDHWTEVKSKVEGLGLKLKLHLEQEEDDDDEQESGGTRAAFAELGDRIEDAFEAFANAARDPAVRTDVQELGHLLKGALQETLSDVGQRVRDRGASEPNATTDDVSPFKDTPDDPTQDTVDGG